MALEKTHLAGRPWKALEPALSQEHREIQDPENLEKGLEATAQPTGPVHQGGVRGPFCLDVRMVLIKAILSLTVFFIICVDHLV